VPELPEVELCRLELEDWCVGHTIVAVNALDGWPLARGTKAADLEALVGQTVLAVERVGKQMALTTSGPCLLVHLGMTGHFERGGDAKTRVSWVLDDGQRIALVDPRRFGKLSLAPAPDWGELGPDALKVAGRRGGLFRCVGTAKGPIKVVLMDQARIAGVGNIYASEACWDAGVHPARPARSLGPEVMDRIGKSLVKSMRRTLRQGMKDPDFKYLVDGGVNAFWVYGREGLPCHRCHTAINRVVQAGRSTYFCRQCQPRGNKRS